MKNWQQLFGDRALWRQTLTLALPIGGQALLAVGMNMADTVMLGKLGLPPPLPPSGPRSMM